MSHYPPLSERRLSPLEMARAERAHRCWPETQPAVYQRELPAPTAPLNEPARVASVRRSVPRAQPQPAIEIYRPPLARRLRRGVRALLAWLSSPRVF